MKKKVQLPGKAGRNKQKHAHQKKALAPRKGGRVIKPKKAKNIEVAKLKKNIEKAIGSNIEAEIGARASSAEPKSFNIVHSSSNVKNKEAKKQK
uniref:Leydig cell tumor 10 kDa protein homolog n=1 Tax=Saccoglossus kowalevskii TaxID=10224 RepID=A0ABM0GQT9_SACKO|nr:PREDICTED: leydig cell tumor 10 kDa protein homolog [Saccoglossus kowalevskii]